MNFTEPLNRILGRLSRVRILRFMIRTGISMSGREIAQAIGLSHVQCNSALRELAEQGIVSVRRVGRANLYELQPDHIIIREWLQPLFRREQELEKRLAEIVVRHLSAKPESLILYGSVARGTEGPASDIDLLCVVLDRRSAGSGEKELMEAGEEVTRLFGNRLSPRVITKKALLRKSKGEDSFIKTVVGGGKVIYGRTLPEMMSDEFR
jgi:predicted nucleotidyltransferase